MRPRSSEDYEHFNIAALLPCSYGHLCFLSYCQCHIFLPFRWKSIADKAKAVNKKIVRLVTFVNARGELMY